MKTVSGHSMRQEANEFAKVMAGDLTENIDNISDEDCEAEATEFLRIAGVASGRAAVIESTDLDYSGFWKKLREADGNLLDAHLALDRVGGKNAFPKTDKLLDDAVKLMQQAQAHFKTELKLGAKS